MLSLGSVNAFFACAPCDMGEVCPLTSLLGQGSWKYWRARDSAVFFAVTQVVFGTVQEIKISSLLPFTVSVNVSWPEIKAQSDFFVVAG